MVKPISPRPSARRPAASRLFRYSEMFSITTMASSTTKPVAMVRAISVRLLIEKSRNTITAKVPTRQRHRDAGNNGRRHVAQEQVDDHHHRGDGQHRSCRAPRRGCWWSGRTCTFTDFGRLSVSCGSIWRMLSAVSMMLARLALDVHHDGPLLVGPRPQPAVFGLFDAGDIAEPDRRPVLISDNQPAIILSGLHLIVSGKRHRAGRTVEAAFAELTLALVIAVRTVSLVRPRAAMARALSFTRTAGHGRRRGSPDRRRKPEIFCATRVSTMSSTRVIGMAEEVTARVMIGGSAGFTCCRPAGWADRSAAGWWRR